ncbi:hypothetical protein A8926_3358 [Saccharopolyspora spinosa]|uniref:Uncharacterized protein n=1 Tax=Saccharopolyspora spinosa TaxID=60894 RepID=A0A2N3XY65_SACSN|nr:hypothetical protein A8926_3358 [Saccharopolyspora spinosa]
MAHSTGTSLKPVSSDVQAVAREVREEMAAMPVPADLVPNLESLAP